MTSGKMKDRMKGTASQRHSISRYGRDTRGEDPGILKSGTIGRELDGQ